MNQKIYSKIALLNIFLIIFSISVCAYWEVEFSNTLDAYKDTFTAGTKEGASDDYDFGIDIKQTPPSPGTYLEMRTRVDGNSLTKDYMAELVVGIPKTWEIRKIINGLEEEEEINEKDTLIWNISGVPLDISLSLVDYGTDSSRTTAVETIDLRKNDSYLFDVSKTGPGTFRYMDFVAYTKGDIINYTMNLVKGWNLISIPLNLTNNSVNYIFNGNFSIYAYNNSWFVPEEINNKLGYWVKANESRNITVTGAEIENKALDLDNHWNLVGYPNLNETNINESALKNYTIFTYIGNEWLSYIPNRTLKYLEEMEPGYGYWVNSN